LPKKIESNRNRHETSIVQLFIKNESIANFVIVNNKVVHLLLVRLTILIYMI